MKASVVGVGSKKIPLTNVGPKLNLHLLTPKRNMIIQRTPQAHGCTVCHDASPTQSDHLARCVHCRWTFPKTPPCKDTPSGKHRAPPCVLLLKRHDLRLRLAYRVLRHAMAWRSRLQSYPMEQLRHRTTAPTQLPLALSTPISTDHCRTSMTTRL